MEGDFQLEWKTKTKPTVIQSVYVYSILFLISTIRFVVEARITLFSEKGGDQFSRFVVKPEEDVSNIFLTIFDKSGGVNDNFGGLETPPGRV